MSQKLFVGNIPYDLSDNDLKSIFEEGGHTVTEVKVITDRFTGKSRGFGFISYESETEAENAIQNFDGRQVGGRTLKVAIAKRKERGGDDRQRREPREERSYNNSSSDYGQEAPQDTAPQDTAPQDTAPQDEAAPATNPEEGQEI